MIPEYLTIENFEMLPIKYRRQFVIDCNDVLGINTCQQIWQNHLKYPQKLRIFENYQIQQIAEILFLQIQIYSDELPAIEEKLNKIINNQIVKK